MLKVGVVDVHVLSHSKVELAWAADKRLQVISNYKVIQKQLYSTKGLKRTKEQSCFKFKTIMYTLLCGTLVMYSYYFERDSTMTFLVLQTRLI